MFNPWFSFIFCILDTPMSQTQQSTCSGSSCVFPFTYNGIDWKQCTYHGRSRKWCAITEVENGVWDYCDEDCNGNLNISSNLSHSHYAYTKGALNNGMIQTLVVSLFFNDRIHDQNMINYTYNTYKTVFDSVSTYFSDASYNKLTYNFTFIGNGNNYMTNLSSATATTDQIATEAYRLSELDGYVYCNGICDRNDLFHHNVNRKSNKYFDQFVVILNSQKDVNPSFGSWSGSAKTGDPITWIVTFNAITMLHEFGHNQGMNHQFTNKYGRIPTTFDYDIGELYDGESVMGGGGHESRFKENGHYGACSKDWFGWFDEQNIVDITANDINDIDFETIMHYKLYPFDRPNISLNDIPNKIFVIRLSWPTQYEFYTNSKLNRIYIFYRTSYEGREAGISIEYCLVNKLESIESGANIQSFTYDINGDTFVQNDHYLSVNESFVIEPFLLSQEDGIIFDTFADPYLAEVNKINITVISKGNGWSDCNEETYVCDNSNELYMDIALNFVSHSAMDEIIDADIHCSEREKHVINLNYGEKYKLIHITSNEIGSYGRGETVFTVYPKNTHIKTYIFDKYPKNIPKTIGSVMSFTFIGNMDHSLDNDIYPVKAIQIIQNEESLLHIAEIEIYVLLNGELINIAVNNSVVQCYSFPEIGHIGDTVIDGDMSTHSRSQSAMIGSYDVCIFNEPVYDIQQIKVYPRDAYWDRSSNLTLNLFGKAYIGSTYNQNAFVFADLLFSYEIRNPDNGMWGEWEDKHEIITIPELSQILEYNSSSMNHTVRVPFIHGQFYILLERLDFTHSQHEIRVDFQLNECEISQCPINTFPNGTNICRRCRKDYYAQIGAISRSDCVQCPFHRELRHKDSKWCTIKQCTQVMVTHNNGLYNKIDGIYYIMGQQKNGKTVYISSSLNYVILYEANKSKYQIIDIQNNEEIANSALTLSEYPFLLDSNEWYENGIIHFADIPNTKIKAIKIIQNANNSNPTFNSLTIAEIKVFSKSDPTLNIAPIYAKCHSFPITEKTIFSAYAGDENGTVYQLTDNSLSTTSNNGNLNDYKYCSQSPCYDICTFSEDIELDHIIIYPPQTNMRFYRTKDLTVQMYTAYGLQDTPAENERFIVYNQRMPIKVNTTINISKIIAEKDKPLHIQCPYKYALSCDAMLNELCGHYGHNWLARNIETNSENNNELEWVCISSDVLTDDLLNYNLLNNLKETNMIKSINKNSVTSTLMECENNYLVQNIVSKCYVGNVLLTDLAQYLFSANDELLCSLTMYNLNGEQIYFNKALSFVDLRLMSTDLYFYPIKGIHYVNNTIWTKIIIPKCDSLWNLSLSFDQSIVGGNKFEIYSEIQINIINNDEFDDEQCIVFNCDTWFTSIDQFDDSFFGRIMLSKHELLRKCRENYTNTTVLPTTTDNYIVTTVKTGFGTAFEETLIFEEIMDDNQEVHGSDAMNHGLFIVLVIGISIFVILVIVLIYVFIRHRCRRLRSRKLHRHISASVVDHGSPSAILKETNNTIQYKIV